MFSKNLKEHFLYKLKSTPSCNRANCPNCWSFHVIVLSVFLSTNRQPLTPRFEPLDCFCVFLLSPIEIRNVHYDQNNSVNLTVTVQLECWECGVSKMVYLLFWYFPTNFSFLQYAPCRNHFQFNVGFELKINRQILVQYSILKI